MGTKSSFDIKKMKLFTAALAISAVSACSFSSSQLAAIQRAIERLIARIEAQQRAATSTAAPTTTTTTRAPSACEIERDLLISSNPDNRHIPTCMIDDGAYKPDQYEASGISYCVNVDGEKMEDTLRNAPWIQN